jgi:hypothetical protein
MKFANLPTPPAFTPFTLTVETKEEAETLWHALNSALPFAYLNRRGLGSSVAVTKGKMFSAYNKQFRPKSGTKRNPAY